MTPILGDKAIISFQGGSGWLPYACATSFALKTSTETKSVKTVGDGYWKKSVGQANGYSLSLQGLVVLDGAYGFFDLKANQMQMIQVPFQLLYEDGQGGVKRIEGQAMITDTTITGPSSDFTTGDIEMEGYGSYQEFSDNGTCASIIINATLDAPGAGRMLRFSANVDTAYITYELRRNVTDAVISSGNVDSPFTASIGSSVASGLCYVVATPYCANDVPGTEFTKSF